MSEKQPIALTEKQQQWLEHINLAKQQGQPLGDYAKQHGLSRKALYHYHWLLKKKGVFESTATTAPFVKVIPTKKPASPTCVSVTIYFPNGIHVQVQGVERALSTVLHQVQLL